MRWPIQFQLLLPMLAVVILGIVAASAASAYLGGIRAQRQQEENLQRVIDTLTHAAFPLTEKVLVQMSGLSGGEFIFLDSDGRRESSTLPVSGDELAAIRRLSNSAGGKRFSHGSLVLLGGHLYLGESLPVNGPWKPSSGTLVVLYRHDRWRGVVWQAVYPALAVGAAAAALAMLVTAGLARRFVRPIQKLGDQTAAIVRGDFQPVVVSQRDDEIRDLALAINHMTERLGQYEAEVRRHERLRTLAQLGAGIAHQMRNAAAGGRLAVELHQRECPAGPDCESLAVALRQFRLMESHLQRFLTFGRGAAARHEPLVLETIVAEALDLVRPACRHAGIELVVHPHCDPLRISGDAAALHQLVVNLVLNAIEAAAQSSRGAPRVVVEFGSDSGRALLCIMDSGPGPAAGVQQRIFEPFVTEKVDGTGLGLFVARQIVEGHGGTLGWRRGDDMTCFTAEFPLLEPGSVSDRERAHGTPADC